MASKLERRIKQLEEEVEKLKHERVVVVYPPTLAPAETKTPTTPYSSPYTITYGNGLSSTSGTLRNG
jgi:hypothetical protein